MNNKNFEYTGWKVNGFVALILILAAIVGGVMLVVFGADRMEPPVGTVMIVAGIVVLLLAKHAVARVE